MFARRRFEWTQGDHTQRHTHTENTQHAGPKQDKNNDFSDKKNRTRNTKSLFSKCPSPVDPRWRAPPVRHGRTMCPENACGASDEVIHSRLFILRVEPSSEGKDILHTPQYQLNLRHSSSTAAVSTQNLDLPGFHPHPGFPGNAGVTRRAKSELSAHQNPGAG